ncbi:MAG: hypothetical protein Q8S52_02565 [Methylobacter sp.]|nr:hypothetical protein [Methylobacter sp.]MDP2430275.1 hypothetical protein [Methylobacter sp.]MDP3053453.1 hypothetical protein [Methylobacter sp.]MDP3360988.1 hypothetical protein [Methylobacter sp.]
MKGLADNITTDLFPVKKSRGRPVTGVAKTSAERQREYRARKSQQWRQDLHAVNLTLPVDANCALKRLAKHHGVSFSDIVAKLVKDADDLLISTMTYDSPEYDDYFK